MKKIPTLFQRDYDSRPALVNPEVTPGCEWVIAGEGVATQKYDGACCAIIEGKLFKRREIDGTKDYLKTPADFILVDKDDTTKKLVGWVPVADGPEDKWFCEAFEDALGDGTYELLGPKVQGNPENASRHYLQPHDKADVIDAPRDYDGLREYLRSHDIEGIVWHHPDGRMAKLKGRDFGFKRYSSKATK